MRNDPCYLGIDLGTSSVKLLLVAAHGVVGRARCAYASATPEGWTAALKQAIADLGSANICGIGLSSQVGTYITDTGQTISWDAPAGREALAQLKAAVTDREWLEQIGMVHPDIVSYPLPRLLHIQKHFPGCKAVFGAKELLLRELTGNAVSDIFSWRGLCHPEKKEYAGALLERFGITVQLPPLALPADLAGHITQSAAQAYGLPPGTPVYVGCNDFFAGLLGMGVWKTGCAFELSGTSAHLGMITDAPMPSAFVSGPYFQGCATYGGTKASGTACDFAIRQFGIDGLSADLALDTPPIFLPYLKGERAPIYDENARGVFFGITQHTTRQYMAYAVLEGVVFSLYHIGQALDIHPETMITGGGSAGNVLMAQLKAALFDCRVYHTEENDSSALGAAMLSMVGGGAFASLPEAMDALVTCRQLAAPDPKLQGILKKRYEIYKQLYSSLKDSFVDFSKLREETI